jgi:protein phosphatase PTC7
LIFTSSGLRKPPSRYLDNMSGLVEALIRPTHRSPMSRLIARKSKQVGFPGLSHYASSAPRPYKFYIGASWAGKPPEPGPKRLQVPFASDSLVGAWRDKTLARPKTVLSKDAGEDFFYVQEVSLQP